MDIGVRIWKWIWINYGIYANFIRNLDIPDILDTMDCRLSLVLVDVVLSRTENDQEGVELAGLITGTL